MESLDKAVVLIPSLSPKKEFIDFLITLKEKFNSIIVVNDGSTEEYDSIFKNIEDLDITVLKNNINLGKGRALKNGINYILNNLKDIKTIVTADSDGQHSVMDIERCAKLSLKNVDSLILGVRDFNKENVPLKSKFGNKLTVTMFKIFVGIQISDTQTGLRAFGIKSAKTFLSILGERFDYETNVLIATKNNDIKIEELKINTIYINENSSTHFNPIKDSISIYKVFIKYIFSSTSSFLIDILLFTLLYNLFYIRFSNTAVFFATIVSRTISSLYNYFINSKLVFSNIKSMKSLVKYYMLVFISMCMSALLVYMINNMLVFINITIIKVIVDVFIFVINFYVQREWVFKKESK